MTITITNSPGASVNFVNGNHAQTTNDVFSIAKAIHPYLNRFALLIKSKKAFRLTLDSDSVNEDKPLEFNQQNQDNFSITYQDVYEDTPIELECGIYRFNKKSRNGHLEFEDDDGQTQSRPFTVHQSLISDCLDAIKSTSAKVTAHREMATNALGETKVKKFHIINIVLSDNSND